MLSVGFLVDDSRSLDSQLDMLGANYLILILLSAIASSISCAAVSERVTMRGQVILAVVVSCLIVPVVAAWTLGKGILAQLYFKDDGACLCLHLAAGFVSLILCC
jgi:ammonia channel protein AmtB